MAVSIRRRRSDETPTDSGVAGARSRACLAAALTWWAGVAAEGTWADGESASGKAAASANRTNAKGRRLRVIWRLP